MKWYPVLYAPGLPPKDIKTDKPLTEEDVQNIMRWDEIGLIPIGDNDIIAIAVNQRDSTMNWPITEIMCQPIRGVVLIGRREDFALPPEPV